MSIGDGRPGVEIGRLGLDKMGTMDAQLAVHDTQTGSRGIITPQSLRTRHRFCRRPSPVSFLLKERSDGVATVAQIVVMTLIVLCDCLYIWGVRIFRG